MVKIFVILPAGTTVRENLGAAAIPLEKAVIAEVDHNSRSGFSVWLLEDEAGQPWPAKTCFVYVDGPLANFRIYVSFTEAREAIGEVKVSP